jgi:multidrug resistance efflux pump
MGRKRKKGNVWVSEADQLQATYDALAKQMADANAALQAKVDAAEAQIAAATASATKITNEYTQLAAEHAALIVESSKKDAQVTKLQADLAAALAALAKVPVVYPNVAGRCIPVLERKGSMCPNCGWTFEGGRVQDKEPHICA